MTAATAELWETLVSLRSRFTFRYSASGRSAACLVTDGRGFMYVEYWTLSGAMPGSRAIPGLQWQANSSEPAPTDALPFDDGSVLVLAPEDLTHVQPDGTARSVGPLPFRPDIVAPAPDGSRRVLFIGRDGPADGACASWLWPGPDQPLHELGTLPPLLLRGGGWADGNGSGYVVNVRQGRHCRPARYDLTTGECTPLPITPSADGDTAWFTARTGAVLLASEYQGAHRLRLFRQEGPAERLSSLDELSGTVVPLAMHAGGRWVTLHVREGLREELAVLDTETDSVSVLDRATGRGLGAVAWVDSADEPPEMWAFSIGAGFPCRAVHYRGTERSEVPDDTPAGGFSAWALSWLERFPGADGEIEGIVCGHQDWRTARQVVLALHGGPAASWSVKFSPLFQLFAAEGITVVALNPRGSTGYDEAFHRLIVDRWAGPDLADVLATARYLRSERGGGRLALYGASYGAFLALVAACAEPELWSRVLAVAPMLSPERLYTEATPEVRAMIDRLGGRTPIDDELGPRDVLALLPRLRAEVMIVHGARDETIPVTQSRRLVAELSALGRRPDVDFQYHEVPEAGHGALDGSAELHQTAARFLSHSE
ncbi:alpha/beta hydrolase family protein [Actinophytocola sp.]|uniref:alpha/beta hydrolase family protein n=1 Tax=Actinophytocola sp. TaxID=1872138 RepID=UPI002ED279CD